MISNESVCAVVVTFNRKELLKQCLISLTEQTEKPEAIILINNASTDGTEQLLLDFGFIDQLSPEDCSDNYHLKNEVNGIDFYYTKMKVNTGGSGGFYEGMKKAHSMNYNWIWLMDDDVACSSNALEVLKSYTKISKCIHPSRKYLNGDRFNWFGSINEYNGRFTSKEDCFSDLRNFRCVNFACFEGMFISSKIVSEIGYPERKYFFCGDDTIYGYKAAQHTNVIYISDILMTRLLDKRNTKPGVMADYLYSRNITIISNEIAKNKFLSNVYRLKETLSLIKSRMIVQGLTKNAIWILIGYFDGLLKNYGREEKLLR